MTIDPFSANSAPETEPPSLVIGEYAVWRRVVAIDATLFDLKYVLRRKVPAAAAQPSMEIPMVSASGSDWDAVVEAGDTTGWESGKFKWDLVVVRKSDTAEKVIQTGEFQIFDDDGDRRTHAEVMLQKIESLLEGRADDDVENYSIKSRAITKMSVDDLLRWRGYYQSELKGQAHSGLFDTPAPKSNTLRTRFRS